MRTELTCIETGGAACSFVSRCVGTAGIVAALCLNGASVTHAVCIASFGPALNYGAGSNPASVAIGDLNGDGRPDLVVANINSNNVSVLLGNGAGFGVAVNYLVGTNPYSVAIGDLNGDGRLDLVTANFVSNNVSVLLGNGNGTFGAAANFGVSSTGPVSVAIGDVNGDGKADVAVANYGRIANPVIAGNVSVLQGNGNGTFASAINYNTDLHPRSVAIGDLNGDGKPDLVVANTGNPPFPAGNVSVLLGSGTGTFQAAVNYAASIGPYSVAIGDLNGDGHPDLAVANFYGGVSVRLGNGDGTYQPAVTYDVGNTPYSVAIGDLNGDGLPDLAVANANSNNVSVLLGNGDGTFAAAVNFAAGGTPYSVAIGDIDRDGLLDLAVAINSGNVATVLRNTLTSVTQQPVNKTVAPGQTASFSVAAPGASFYQWRHRGVPLPNGGHFSGVVTSTLTITNAASADAGPYDVRIIGGCHSGEYSRPAMLCVMAPVCRGDFNNDNLFNAADIPAIVSALLAGQTCP